MSSLRDKRKKALGAVRQAMTDPQVASATKSITIKNEDASPSDARKKEVKKTSASKTKAVKSPSKLATVAGKPEANVESDKVRPSVQLRIYNLSEIDKALELQTKSGAIFNRTIRGHADQIIKQFHTRIENQDFAFNSVGNIPSSKHHYKTSITLTIDTMNKLRNTLDPFNLYSDSQVVSDAISQISVTMDDA